MKRIFCRKDKNQAWTALEHKINYLLNKLATNKQYKQNRKKNTIKETGEKIKTNFRKSDIPNSNLI